MDVIDCGEFVVLHATKQITGDGCAAAWGSRLQADAAFYSAYVATAAALVALGSAWWSFYNVSRRDRARNRAYLSYFQSLIIMSRLELRKHFGEVSSSTKNGFEYLRFERLNAITALRKEIDSANWENLALLDELLVDHIRTLRSNLNATETQFSRLRDLHLRGQTEDGQIWREEQALAAWLGAQEFQMGQIAQKVGIHRRAWVFRTQSRIFEGTRRISKTMIDFWRI